jgi:polyisoprenoid-binding protein YceI
MNLKKILILFFCFTVSVVHAQKYIPADAGSKVHFTIKNFGIKTGGQLTGLKGEIVFSPDDIPSCHFNVSVEANTIDTDNDSRDGHLRKEGYFDADKYPQITITSTKIDKTNKTDSGFYYFTGTLTMHGITKPVAFPFHAEKIDDNYLFTANFEINRIDFGVGDNSAVLSNTVNISLSILSKKI